jgi:hypothetical protein
VAGPQRQLITQLIAAAKELGIGKTTQAEALFIPFWAALPV